MAMFISKMHKVQREDWKNCKNIKHTCTRFVYKELIWKYPSVWQQDKTIKTIGTEYRLTQVFEQKATQNHQDKDQHGDIFHI